jgi:hypothetical protein
VPSRFLRVASVIISGTAIFGVCLAGTGIAIATNRTSSDLFNGVVVALAGLFLVWNAVSYRRGPLVTITATYVRSRGLLGITHRCPRSEVASVDLGAKVLPKSTVATLVPYAQRTDGTRMWLLALAGLYVGQPIPPEQLDVIRQLRSVLGLDGSDVFSTTSDQ